MNFSSSEDDEEDARPQPTATTMATAGRRKFQVAIKSAADMQAADVSQLRAATASLSLARPPPPPPLPAAAAFAPPSALSPLQLPTTATAAAAAAAARDPFSSAAAADTDDPLALPPTTTTLRPTVIAALTPATAATAPDPFADFDAPGAAAEDDFNPFALSPPAAAVAVAAPTTTFSAAAAFSQVREAQGRPPEPSPSLQHADSSAHARCFWYTAASQTP